MDQKIEERLSRCRTLPSPPGIVLAILKALNDPDVTPQHLARLIEKDPALAAQLLRIVNSPYFGVKQTVTSLPQAAAFLGIGGIRTMSLAFSLSHGLFGKAGSKRSVDDLLKRSVVSAGIARELAGALQVADPEEAFLAALLQDIGILALREVLGSPYDTLLARSGENHGELTAQERELLGTDHAETGSWLLGIWGLPAVFQTSVRISHGPVDEGMNRSRIRLADCVAAADILAGIWLTPVRPEGIRSRAMEAARLLDVGEDRIQGALQRISEVLPDVLALFEIASVMDDLEGILEEVRQNVLVSSLQDIIQVREKEAALVSLSAEVHQLRRDVVKDSLTGVFNRQFFEDSLANSFRRAVLEGGSLCVCFCDLDDFKLVNDRLGHLKGDLVLREVASLLAREVRNEDLVCRYGGDEFVLLLPNCSPETAASVCERIRAKVAAAMPDLVGDSEADSTLSIGFSVLDSGRGFPDARALLNAADQALYQAKALGRNRVVGFRPQAGTATDTADGAATRPPDSEIENPPRNPGS